MITSPTIDDLLEGVILALDTDIMPALGDAPKAQASAQMMQSLLQGVRQLLPDYEATLVREHNEMGAALRESASHLEGIEGPEADQMRKRAAGIGSEPDLPPPGDKEAIRVAHQARAKAMRDCLYDLDALQRSGVAEAEASLTTLRAALTPHYLNYMGTFPMQGGMLGRG